MRSWPYGLPPLRSRTSRHSVLEAGRQQVGRPVVPRGLYSRGEPTSRLPRQSSPGRRVVLLNGPSAVLMNIRQDGEGICGGRVRNDGMHKVLF